MQRGYYAKKITIRLTQQDVDFIEGYAKIFGVSFKQSVRIILAYSQSNLDSILNDKCDIRIIRGQKIPYVLKLMLWVPQDISDYIDSIAEKNDVPNQEASRFLIRLAEYDKDKLHGRTNFFIVK